VVDDARLEQLRRKHRPKLYPSRTDLLESLTSRSARQFEAGLEAAQRAGVDGESALVEALDQVARTRRPDIVSALRGATGRLDSTDALLQRLVREESGPGPDAQALRNWARSTMPLPNSTDARGP
jgi:hypothetical protein